MKNKRIIQCGLVILLMLVVSLPIFADNYHFNFPDESYGATTLPAIVDPGYTRPVVTTPNDAYAPNGVNAPNNVNTQLPPSATPSQTQRQISSQEWNIVKSFVALIITAEDAMERDRDSIFVLQNGRIRERDFRGVDTYTITNAEFVPYRNRRVTFAARVNGMFSYEDDEGIFNADLSAVFPNIGNNVHTFKLISNDPRRPDMGAVIELDGKSYALTPQGVYNLMFSGYEVAREYMWL